MMKIKMLRVKSTVLKVFFLDLKDIGLIVQKLHILTEHNSSLTSGTSQTCKQQLKNTIIECNLSSTSRTTQPHQTYMYRCTRTLNVNSSIQRVDQFTKKRAPQVVCEKEVNAFSVGLFLQLAKVSEKPKAQELQKTSKIHVKLKLTNSPPLNAKLKRCDEDYENFFQNHISFYKEQMKIHCGYTETGSGPSQTNHIPLFTLRVVLKEVARKINMKYRPDDVHQAH
uniref:Uncharacterized protein n=1 Tax=Cuerna arida TaxID=1464854 RepID=A0A1B6EIF7_9HEMI